MAFFPSAVFRAPFRTSRCYSPGKLELAFAYSAIVPLPKRLAPRHRHSSACTPADQMKRERTLSAEIVDLIWLDLENEIGECLAVRQITIMQEQLRLLVNVAIEMIDSTSRKTARASHQSMDAISFVQKQFRKIGTILPCNTSDKS